MKTDKDLVGILIIDTNAEGLIINCTTKGNLDVTANKFAVGCLMTDTTSSKIYRNSGTSALPSWEDMTTISSSEIDPSIIRTAVVSLTSANIKAMSATPVTLIAGVTGKTIVIDDICLKMTTTATGYTGGGAVEFRYTDGSGAKVTADIASTVITAEAGTSFTINKSITTSLVGVVDAPIVITNATEAFATGTGTGVITCRYHLI